MSCSNSNSNSNLNQSYNLESLFNVSGHSSSSGQVEEEFGGNLIDTPSEQVGSSKRGKTGCITCRLRKKRCDEAKPICATCSRLGIECMGYGVKRPKWLRENDNAKKAKQNIQEVAGTMKPGLEVMDVDLTTDNDNLRTQAQPQTHQPYFWELGSIGTNASTSSSNNTLNWNLSPNTGSTNTNNTHNNPFEQQSTSNTTTSTNNFVDSTSSTSTDNLYSGFFSDPSLFPPPSMNTVGPADIGPMIPSIPGVNDISMDALWGILFGPQPPPDFTLDQNGSHISPNISSMINQDTPVFNLPSPTSGISNGLSPLGTSTASPNLAYLHHYLNVVLPLQYRIMGISISIGDFVAPLALQRNEVLTSVSSLAALHMVAQRTKKRPHNLTTLIEIEKEILEGSGEYNAETDDADADDGVDEEDNDADTRVASISHQRTMERLRFISPQDLTTEEITISVLFAVSYHLFCGGTSKHLKELLSISQRCLSAALYSSPEIGVTNASSKAKSQSGPSPWSRYHILIEHMIWIDILASVTYNKASTLLPVYRKILNHMPLPFNSDANLTVKNASSSGKPLVLMDRLMGCDNTTLLAMAETVALSEWKDRAESAGCLSYKELLDRAANVEKILNERAWRESHLDRPINADDDSEDSAALLRRVMSDVFHGSVKVLLAITINGPFPRVPEIAAAVGETMEALTRLDIQHSNVQIHRAVVLPITVAGCHCETIEQQTFFRDCFQCLGPEARAFGNTGPALELMEEVWRRRSTGEINLKVDWRQTMYDLGWQSGILLI
uniref:Zn(2)-C6 fungal-type domain-containing protein n=1 Tax=Kwoniella pini CBS 10737 TaxID=1296096 RepID=A0A1B9HVP4_9TREE|nr:uncharacterized protein I206_06229 [Kwoniella pini CBS 10737]OCF47333.1 hypothetical protein I206_06229 [Kwoniella pini CBS 10737]